MRILSGIQPTGSKHLGNYTAAISQYVAEQDRGEALCCIVDLHATTVAYESARLRESLYDLTALPLRRRATTQAPLTDCAHAVEGTP
jgi:tryptophanyl-tRNA synthetase